ncbi:MAG: 3-keto-5-aminohexanoate cleavage protein [Pseudomonadota bacterium]
MCERSGGAAMLQACLNGGRMKADAPGVPITPEELAADAAAARAAGADELHLHPRGADGAESLAPGDVGAAIAAVRAAAPGMPVGVGTGAWIAPGGRARLAHIAGWETLAPASRPDYASVNAHEEDAAEVMAILDRLGVRVEAGIWTPAAAERFLVMRAAPPPLRILVEMTSDDADEARRIAQETIARLRAAHVAGETPPPILLHGQGGSVWPMLRMAKAAGYDTRIGFEDGLALPEGGRAQSNSALVAAAAALMAAPAE